MLRDGDLVELHLTGTLDDGAVVETSRGRRARVFVVGRGQLLPAFEAAIRSLSAGERATFRLEPAEAYGSHDPALVYRLPRQQAGPAVRVGKMVELSGGAPARIVAIDDASVTVDANHPLAGQAITFEVEIVSVRRVSG